MRIRPKIHKSNSLSNGYIQASITASLQPIQYPPMSPYSLDGINRLPLQLEVCS